MNLHFYHCDTCGKTIAVLSGTEIPTICCGQKMRELIPNKTDAAVEKHVPVVTVSCDTITVQVGSTPHPMAEEHSITWIGLKTAQGFQIKELHPGDSPEACFRLSEGDCAEAAYACCNLHGLWISEAIM